MPNNSNYAFTDNLIKKNHLTDKSTNIRKFRENLISKSNIKSPIYNPDYSMQNNASSKILLNKSLMMPEEQNEVLKNDANLMIARVNDAIKKIENNKVIKSQIKKNQITSDILMSLFKKNFETGEFGIEILDKNLIDNIKEYFDGLVRPHGPLPPAPPGPPDFPDHPDIPVPAPRRRIPAPAPRRRIPAVPVPAPAPLIPAPHGPPDFPDHPDIPVPAPRRRIPAPASRRRIPAVPVPAPRRRIPAPERPPTPPISHVQPPVQIPPALLVPPPAINSASSNFPSLESFIQNINRRRISAPLNSASKQSPAINSTSLNPIHSTFLKDNNRRRFPNLSLNQDLSSIQDLVQYNYPFQSKNSNKKKLKSNGISAGRIQDKMYRYPPYEILGQGFFSSLINIGKSLLGKLFGVGKKILSKPENIAKVYNTTKQVYDTTKNAINTIKSDKPIAEKITNIIPNVIQTGKEVYDTTKNIMEGNGTMNNFTPINYQTPNSKKLLHSIRGTGKKNINYYKL